MKKQKTGLPDRVVELVDTYKKLMEPEKQKTERNWKAVADAHGGKIESQALKKIDEFRIAPWNLHMLANECGGDMDYMVELLQIPSERILAGLRWLYEEPNFPCPKCCLPEFTP